MSTSTATSNEPLPGYSVAQRIGSGGYGEVFQVEAPGGLMKAMKIVHGYVDERRAKEELKALERIKEVRHPFLLSLERIEIVDGRLIVIMELAEESLKDCFNRFVSSRGSGIPRQDLLSYMRDAADALDYLCKEYSLQHLDVKPENLLLLAGHVKVADFGMVKDLANTGVSLVAGLTPFYAAPEVFRGNPTRYSDQYSLAVLYQQMLTGEFPFAGVTAAEIAQQHLNDEPELSHLPREDRAVLGRALSKSPERRFANCREMIEALRQAGNVAKASSGEQADASLSRDSPEAAVPLKPAGQHATQVIQTTDLESSALKETAVELADLPEPVEETVSVGGVSAGFAPAPTIFIGIGGAAARVLGHLRRRTVGHFGSSARVPAIKMLLLDTDPKTLADASHSNGRSRISADETLALPLRRPQDYRSARSQHLRWISRRWLYNIPRSLRTDGIRPLGRLAFVDHVQQTAQRIRQLLKQVTDEESINESSEYTGLAFDSRGVRIYIISSISGGTGSGMVLDVAYTVRGLLAKIGLADAEVCGMLMHSTSRIARVSELAKINAFSWLTEFNHFNRAGGSYVGDPSCGGLLEESDASSFDRAYLSHLGDRLSDGEFDAAADNVAEFVFQDSLTSARQFYSACFHDKPDADFPINDQAELRTIGISWRSAIDESLVDRVVAAISRRIISSWLGHSEGAGGPPVALPNSAPDSKETRACDTKKRHTGTEFVTAMELSPEAVTQYTSRIVAAELGASGQDFFDKLVAGAGDRAAVSPRSSLVETIDSVFSGPVTDCDEVGGESGILGKRHDSLIRPRVDDLGEQIQGWLSRELEDENPRLSATLTSADWLETHLREMESNITSVAAATGREILDARQAILAEVARGYRGSHLNSLYRYFQLRLSHSGLIAAIRLILKLRSATVLLREELLEAGRDIRSWIEVVSSPVGVNVPRNESSRQLPAGEQGSLEDLLNTRLRELATESGRQFQTEFVQVNGGMCSLLKAGPTLRKSAIDTLRAIIRKRVTEVINSVDLVERIASDDGVSDAPRLFDRLLEESDSSLNRFCGKIHRLLVLPDSTSSVRADSLRESLRDKVACVEARQHAVVACCEAGPLSLAHLAFDIVDSRTDYADFAQRVHTRIDVHFSKLLANSLVDIAATTN